jgi:hypothetical protein
MLKLTPNPTFDAPVHLPIPGQKESAVINFKFRYKNTDEVTEFTARIAGRPDLEVLTEIVVGWSGVEADFSESALGELLKNYHGLAMLITKAYYGELYKARAGN